MLSTHALLLLAAVLSTSAPDAPAPQPAPAAPALSGTSSPGEAPSATAPGASTGSLHLLDTQKVEDANNERAGRIALESLAGFGMGIGGAGLSGLALNYNLVTSPPLALIPMSLLVLGNSLGVTLVGSAMNGSGNFSSALLGSAIGLAVPAVIGGALLAAPCLVGYSRSNCQAAALVPFTIAVLVLPTIGAVVGYELSSAGPLRLPGSTSGSLLPAPRVVPVLAPASQGVGATVGLAGIL